MEHGQHESENTPCSSPAAGVKWKWPEHNSVVEKGIARSLGV